MGVCLRLIFLFLFGASLQAQTWESVKHEIAHKESAHGKFRVGKNGDGTEDLGLYQINSANLIRHSSGKRLADAFDKIFKKYGIDTSFVRRVKAVRDNDKLNEELAREIYRQRGIKAWTSMRRKNGRKESLQRDNPL